MATYQSIFNERGDRYQEAMRRFPNARDKEFGLLCDLLIPKEGEIIIDIPSGGCYLRHFFPKEVKIVSVDPSEVFLGFCPPESEIIESSIDAVALSDGIADGIYSLSGIHHLVDKTSFFREAARLLKSGGRFALADVGVETGVGQFLNGFVDRFNPQGHVGIFLDVEKTAQELISSGFEVSVAQAAQYTWDFNDELEMAHYFRLMFGLSNEATDAMIIEAAHKDLGVVHDYEGVHVQWELLHFLAYKR